MKKLPPGKYWNETIDIQVGCQPCSPGCEHCWAAAMGQRFGEAWGWPDGIVEGGKWTGKTYMPPPARAKVERWKAPRVIAVNWKGDLFHGKTFHASQTLRPIAYDNPKHIWLLLTKHSRCIPSFSMSQWHFDNLWYGITICNQKEADEKIGYLLQARGCKWLSIEPMLGPIDIPLDQLRQLGQVIIGGETGPGARPMAADWVRRIKDDCGRAGVPFFFKQWGGGRKDRFLDGVEHNNLAWGDILRGIK